MSAETVDFQGGAVGRVRVHRSGAENDRAGSAKVIVRSGRTFERLGERTFKSRGQAANGPIAGVGANCVAPHGADQSRGGTIGFSGSVGGGGARCGESPSGSLIVRFDRSEFSGDFSCGA